MVISTLLLISRIHSLCYECVMCYVLSHPTVQLKTLPFTIEPTILNSYFIYFIKFLHFRLTIDVFVTSYFALYQCLQYSAILCMYSA